MSNWANERERYAAGLPLVCAGYLGAATVFIGKDVKERNNHDHYGLSATGILDKFAADAKRTAEVNSDIE